MCRRVTCSSCEKPSYAGCGMHIESVLGDVAPKDRCTCRDAASAPAKDSSWLNKLARSVR